jgi:thiamine biosynthesis lipoprotein
VDLDGGIGLAGDRGPGQVRRFSHEAMNTVFEIHVADADPRYGAEAAQAAFALVDRLEGELSRFRPNSDITRINHLGPGETARVGEAAIECLVIARHMYDLTAGAFDIAIGSGLPGLEIDADGCEVRATAAGVRIDLGGIGKGYAVDLVAELLEEWGLDRAFVHGGFSSAVALEPPDGADGWTLTLSDPRPPAPILRRLSMRQTALSASGVKKGDHIRDPRTGTPVRGRLAAWVALPRPAARPDAGETSPPGPRLAPGAVADALTTAFMLLPDDAIAALCARSPGLEAWILPEDAAGGGLLQFPAGRADILAPAPTTAGDE